MDRIAWAVFCLLIFPPWGLSLRAQAPTPKPKQVNTDDMWVAAPPTELPAGVTHHAYRSASMQRNVG